MDKGFAMVVGMTIAYAASFCGLLLAWRSWKKHHGERPSGGPGSGEPDSHGEEEK